MDAVKKYILSATSNVASNNRAVLDNISDLVPQARIAKKIVKLVIGIVVVLCIILVITSIILFSTHHATAGIWTLGCAIAIASYSTWAHYYRWDIIGAYDGGDDADTIEYSPQDYDYM